MLSYSDKLNSTDKYYVYLHRRNDTNEIFYVGKGSASRYKDNRKRSKAWKDIVKLVGYTSEILYKNLSEEEAFVEEIKLIERLKRANINIVNKLSGGLGYIEYKQFLTKLKSDNTKKAWSEGKYDKRDFEGINNPFYNKNHSIEQIEKWKKDRYSPILCRNLDTNEEFITSGTRNIAKIIGIPRQTITRILKHGRTKKTRIRWEFKRL